MGRSLASPMTVGAIADLLSVSVTGNSETLIHNVASLSHAAEGALTFFSDKKHAKSLALSQATAVIAPADASVPAHCAHLVHPKPHLAFVQLIQQLFPENGVSSEQGASFYAHSTVTLNDAVAHAFVSIDEHSCIGFRTQLHSGVSIGRDVIIGDDCVLYPGVVVRDGVRIGHRCIIQPGAVIGSDGFGFQPTATGWLKVPQIGAVVIGNDVEIGANTTIDRGAIEDTIIGDGVKIDNLVQIAHNVQIGDHTAIAGCAGVAGSAVIGKRCMIGGAAMIVGHIEICDDVIVSGGTLVSDSIREPGRYTGVFPQGTHREWMRTAATLRRASKHTTKKND